jgi:hypothetical protein
MCGNEGQRLNDHYDWSQEPATAPLQIAVGTHVELLLVDQAGETERLAFDIVEDAVADFADGFLGVGTPLAKTLLGRQAGDTLSYRVADMVEARVLSVSAGRRVPDTSVVAKRRAVVQEAVSKSNRDDAVRHALTFSSKWGDYDPEGIESGWEDSDDAGSR